MEAINLPIQSRPIPEEERLNALPRFFGTRALVFENAVFETIQNLSDNYHGGYWHFYETSNDAFFMAPDRHGDLKIEVPGNGYQGYMSPDAAGITACLFVLAAMAARFQEERFIDLYHGLRDYALEHREAAAILSAID
ncbi:antirestriction protein [Thioalkalivibrio sp. ALE20]|uniref:antirestriction protein n=1 Tax=Thioalkalivibrio sp. ALE20 TaxID=545275 RepID=UPI00037A7F91|nr:antirestriction protein [Thioalkalivibrio sp. ALE20]